jgi:PAS domain S-box-containing protein
MSEDPSTQLHLLEQKFQALQAEYDTLKQQKNEVFHQVFYRIAERATAGLSFYDFLKEVHTLMGELLPAHNLFVALCNHAHNTVSFPYYVDERDGDMWQRDDMPRKRNMTEYVLRTGMPQLIDAARFVQLRDSGEITQAAGDLTFTSWLGVPLNMHGRVSGALVVQSYTDGVSYTDRDADVLGFVAHHVSSAIERYQTIEALRKSEERYRLVIDKISLGVTVIQDGRMIFANPALVRILGYPLEWLLTQPFSAIAHPDDVAVMVERQRQRRRMRGETVPSDYTFRSITQTGEVRQLEVSAVLIEWGQRAATLAFVTDATPRIAAEDAQRMALQQQTELNDIKTRFISMTSHEFRTPLTSIHGSVDLLMHYDDRLPVDKKHQILQNINDAVERMTHMLGNVMQMGRSDAGQLQFRPKPLAFTSFCLSLIEELRESMPRQFAKVQLELDLLPAKHQFMLDETLIRNIVGNLLSNAIKYSPQGGTVTFTARKKKGEIVLTVSDHGIGIPQADQALLFQTFHRASNVGAIAGTGLGLSIVKEAVICHQGHIEVQSTEGKGSQFTVMLPASTVTA